MANVGVPVLGHRRGSPPRVGVGGRRRKDGERGRGDRRGVSVGRGRSGAAAGRGRASRRPDRTTFRNARPFETVWRASGGPPNRTTSEPVIASAPATERLESPRRRDPRPRGSHDPGRVVPRVERPRKSIDRLLGDRPSRGASAAGPGELVRGAPRRPDAGPAMHHLRAFGRLLDDLDDQAEEDTLEGFMRQGTQVEPDREGAGGPRPVTEAGVEHRSDPGIGRGIVCHGRSRMPRSVFSTPRCRAAALGGPLASTSVSSTSGRPDSQRVPSGVWTASGTTPRPRRTPPRLGRRHELVTSFDRGETRRPRSSRPLLRTVLPSALEDRFVPIGHHSDRSRAGIALSGPGRAGRRGSPEAAKRAGRRGDSASTNPLRTSEAMPLSSLQSSIRPGRRGRRR